MKPLHVPEVGDAWHQAMMAGRRAEGWGVARPCLGCGGTAYSAGQHCLGCEARQGGWDRESGAVVPAFRPRPAVEVVERAEVTPPAFVCEAHPCEHPEPGPVADLRKWAVDCGWELRTQHSRGGVMGGTGKQLAEAEMWSVRFRRDAWCGYAVRRGAEWSSVWVAGTGLPPFGKLGVTGLREWLADPARPAGWYVSVLLKQEAQALAAKIVPCPGVKACRWDDPQSLRHTHRGNGDIKEKRVRKAKEHGG